MKYLFAGQPVVVGEWGGRAEVGTRDGTWNQWYVEWMRSKCITNNVSAFFISAYC